MISYKTGSKTAFGTGNTPAFDNTYPFMFTISRFGDKNMNSLYDTVMVLHCPPDKVETKMTKVKASTSTYGGYVEWVWPDELDVISASGTTGGFLTKFGYLGNTAGDLNRTQSVAYQKFLDFLDLYRNNGMLYTSDGRPVLRSNIIMSYDRGSFLGHFTTFNVDENADKPFLFNLDWEFKVERQILGVSYGQ